MANTSGWFKCPNAVLDYDLDHQSFRLYQQLLRLANNTTRRYQCSQDRLATLLRVSVRTIQRSLAVLRKIGLVTVHRLTDGRGYRSINIYYLPLDLAQAETDNSLTPTDGASLIQTLKPKSSPSLRSGERGPSALRAPGRATPDLIGETMNSTDFEQLALFSPDQVDKRHVVSDTGKKITNVRSRKKGWTPTGRVLRYWIGGRKTTPSKRDIAVMGKVINKCLEAGHSESELTAAFDHLMRTGVDASFTQLSAYFNLPVYRQRKQRDYQTHPLYMRQPKPCSMTEARKDQLRSTPMSSKQSSTSRTAGPTSDTKMRLDAGPTETSSLPSPDAATLERLEQYRQRRLRWNQPEVGSEEDLRIRQIDIEDKLGIHRIERDEAAKHRTTARDAMASLRLKFGLDAK